MLPPPGPGGPRESLRQHVENRLPVVESLGQPGMKLSEPRGHFLGRAAWPDAVIFAGDELHQCSHVLHFDPAERIIEQRIEIKLDRPGPRIRLQPYPLDPIEPAAQFRSEMSAQLFRKRKADELDEMLVDRLGRADQDFPRDRPRVRHFQDFVELHGGLPAAKDQAGARCATLGITSCANSRIDSRQASGFPL